MLLSRDKEMFKQSPSKSKLRLFTANIEIPIVVSDGLVLNLAINYGSRAEIVRATKKITQEVLEGRIVLEDLDEKHFGEYLYTSGLPEIDLLIRPGGDMRISNFLLWQIAYAEIWLTPIFWPDFNPELFINAIRDFQKRDRRFGGLNSK